MSTATPEALDDPTQGGEAAYIPLGYLVDFMEFLHAARDRVRVITYDDLAWGDDFDHEAMYPRERERWLGWLADGTLDPSLVYVLLQHDVDTREERTLALLREQERLGIRSNVMVFNRRVDRRHLAATGELRFTPYDLDFDYLRRLDAQGFVIGYHQNAHEQAIFDVEAAQRIFVDDVEALAARVPVRYFSAHGGTPGPEGRNNRDVPLPESLRGRVRWVHNGHGPWFAATYSDGGINSPRRDPEKRDLRDFVRTWKPGHRYRVLTHPQYYHQPCKRSPRLDGTAWYEEVLAAYEPGGQGAWNDVRPSLEPAVPPSRWRARAGRLYRWLRRAARSTQPDREGKQ